MADLIAQIAQLMVDDNAVLLVGDRLRHADRQGSVLGRIAAVLAERIDYQRSDLSLPTVARDFEILKGRSELILAVQSELEKFQSDSDAVGQLLADAVMPHTKIITTRFDQALENALREFDKRYVVIVRDTDIPAFDETRVAMIKIHGDITRPDSLVITEDDLDDFFDNLPTVSDVIRAFFATKTLVFLGYDLNDEIFKRTFRQVARNVSAFQRPAFAIVPAPLDEVEAKYWEAQNVQVIVEEPRSFLDDLARTIKTSLDETRIPSERPLARVAEPRLPARPYKALESFTAADVAIFSGRMEESQRLANRILANRLTVLYGESGSGKTSLLGAGSGPILAKQRALLSVCSPVPGRSLLESISTSLREAWERLGLSPPDDMDLSPLVRSLAAELDGPVVLAIDQFEQFFLPGELDERGQSAAFLGEIVANRSLDVRLVLVIREDFLGRLQSLEEVVPGLLDTRFRLERLDREGARAAIEEPANAFGVRWDAELVQALLDDLYDSEGRGIAPPQLQIICDQLYSRAVEAASGLKTVRITAELYHSLGGTQAILGDYLEQSIEGFALEQQPTVRRLLGALVSSSGIKQRLPLNVLARAVEADSVVVESILGELTRQRLVQRYESSGDEQTAFELTHDYLASRIALWLGDDFWIAQKAREIMRYSLPEWEKRARLLAPDDLSLVRAQRGQVRYSGAETELIFASAMTYDQGPEEWGNALDAKARSDVLLILSRHELAAARRQAAGGLAAFDDIQVVTRLAEMAVEDGERSVRQAAARAIADGDLCQAVEMMLESSDGAQDSERVRQALVWIRDRQPGCQEWIPKDMQPTIQRQVWVRRWGRHKPQILNRTLRGAQGGLVGLGLGMGLFLGLGDALASGFEIEHLAAQWRLIISLMSVGIPLVGAVGALAGAGGAFISTLLAVLEDKPRPWRDWGIATLTGALIMGLGFSLLASIFIADEQPFQAAGGGLLIGFAVIGVVLAPLKISTILRGLLAVGVGIGTFLIAWVLGWLFVPAAWWMIVMGAVAGAGFYFGLRCKSMGPTQEET